MEGTLPGWMLLWVIVASLVLLALTILLWSVVYSLRELREDVVLGRSTDHQHEAADLWRRERQRGMVSQLDIRRRPLVTAEHEAHPMTLEVQGSNEPEQAHPKTLEERAALIDQRARDSYYHGTYCAEVPRVALQQLQEAVAEKQERCAQVAEARLDATAADIALAIRNGDGTGGP